MLDLLWALPERPLERQLTRIAILPANDEKWPDQTIRSDGPQSRRSPPSALEMLLGFA
jgi:hypothetical protein